MQENEILVFKGLGADSGSLNSYSGRMPPELRQITIEGELYHLTIVPFEGKEYLVAHDDSLLPAETHKAIVHQNLKPIKR